MGHGPVGEGKTELGREGPVFHVYVNNQKVQTASAPNLGKVETPVIEPSLSRDKRPTPPCQLRGELARRKTHVMPKLGVPTGSFYGAWMGFAKPKLSKPFVSLPEQVNTCQHRLTRPAAFWAPSSGCLQALSRSLD